MRPLQAFLAACALSLLGAQLLASCSTSSSASTTTSGSGAGHGGNNTGGSTGLGGAGQGGGGDSCEPPDVLVLLDRTLSMHLTPEGVTPADSPSYESSKWHQAITAVESLVKPPLDQGVRFGLSLWPRDPGGETCLTLAERVTNSKQPMNPHCEPGEIAISPALGNGTAIQDLLDPATTRLCYSTPTGEGLLIAEEHLEGIAAPGREQYVVLVTDGADWDASCPDPDPLPIVQQLADKGIKVFVVSFSATSDAQTGTEGTAFLNNMACAGQTAKGFPAPCTQDADGRWVATDPNAGALYLKAGNAAQLNLALRSVGHKLCCNCEDTCDPPELLIALDRTQTMHYTPAGEKPIDAPTYGSSKWHQAITAIEKLVAPPRDKNARFGLELWPRDPGGDACVTLAERVTNSKSPTNVACDVGEIVIEPALETGSAIQAALDPATTLLCGSTPTGDGLLTATEYLLTSTTPGRDQYVVLVTDGADWASTCSEDPDPLPIVQQLASIGVRTYVVGFSAEGANQQGGVGAAFLNDLACAGQTAPGFPAPCVEQAGGYVAAEPDGPLLYLQAEDSAALDAALGGVVDDLCCNCVE